MNTILFDLDGTLLSMDMILFEKLYFRELTDTFSDIMEPEKFAKNIWESTKAMVKNTEFRTNEEVFMEDFGKRLEADISVLKNRFDEFYDTRFLNVREAVHNIESIKESVKILKEKGYKIVVATNPMFPAKAIYHRIRWAGFDPEEFSYISTFETNHYCKPQLKYYEEILKDIEKSPVECLMVGNDVQEDLVAKNLGMKTYLITDNMLHRTEDAIITDYKGNYEEFFQFVKELPKADS
ncbi:HAD family hydrolase [Clostridium sp. CX1]|uniref:HAD family hydrolase n=1 Tax=Clostridium sp. CX1 TaxID=2978346 RepID=UPI0021BF3825|nr:HAD family hydrolase [Clostridium sp. CX1]MCT8975439.1 HAD family hydrolase [Clostridium sp. CX1]